jgi:hypothetical protein
MAQWIRKPQEVEDQKYFFNGGFFVTATIKNTLTDEDILFIYNDVRQFAEAKNGIDYIQVYESDTGLKVWIIDELDQSMIESGEYNKEDNRCTLLFPSER